MVMMTESKKTWSEAGREEEEVEARQGEGRKVRFSILETREEESLPRLTQSPAKSCCCSLTPPPAATAAAAGHAAAAALPFSLFFASSCFLNFS